MAGIVRLFLMVLLLAAPMAQAQSAWWLGGVVAGGSGNTGPSASLEDMQPNVAIPAPDYEEWTRFAANAEERIEALGTPSDELDRLRGELAGWRERFLAAQDANRSRIETLRTQIAALGPVPAEGETEPPEISARRVELTEQLSRLQAPGIAAEEAFRRSDGLIREIDRILRSRDTDELLRRSPTPLNPGNLFGAVVTLTQVGTDIVNEAVEVWTDPDRRSEIVGALPVILFFFAIALISVLRVRVWIDRLTHAIQARLPASWADIVAFPLSLGQVVLPVVGVGLFLRSVVEVGVWGPLTTRLLGQGLPIAAMLAFLTLWIAAHVFPEKDRAGQILYLSADRRAEGRLHLGFFALLLVARVIVDSTVDPARFGDVVSIIYFPLTVVSGLLLLRIGQLLRQSAANEIAQDGNAGFRPRLIALMGKGAGALGLIGPILAAVGYAGLGSMMVYPAMASLGLLAVVALLQRLVNSVYALAFGRAEGGGDALVPVLINFALALASMPLLALFWGARWADLLEVWLRFREGFRLGETRISPSDFVFFLLVFALIYGLTRLLQSALKSSILPKTTLDAGGRNAIVAGVGYIGIFIAALAAITSTGLDLSSLAIVAGALSVGIGFGLQNIVSNFVSGIILLIERPVAEGDWIQAGGVQGRVKAISVRSTRIETFDRTDVIVPNADLISGTVTNWTGFNLTGRIIIPVGVAYGTDTRKVERILLEVAEAQALVMLDPKPVVLFMGFGASSLDFELRVILRDINFGLSVRSEINHAIAARFNEEGIEIPFPQQDLWLRNPEVLHTPPPPKPSRDLPEPAPKGPIAPDSDLMRDGLPADPPDQG
jgi:small-conductance mechanosensitive channel